MIAYADRLLGLVIIGIGAAMGAMGIGAVVFTTCWLLIKAYDWLLAWLA